MPVAKTSSAILPTAETIDVIYVRLGDGRIVPRRADEVVARPVPPAGRA